MRTLSGHFDYWRLFAVLFCLVFTVAAWGAIIAAACWLLREVMEVLL